MYARIMIPVDLTHADKLDKALKTAAGLASLYNIPVHYVGVTSNAPSGVAHTPEEYAGKLEAFAAGQARDHGVEQTSKAYVRHDPSVELGRTLLDAIDECGADLVVMASHVPGLPDHLFTSHAGHLATHSSASVFVVR